MAEDYIKQLQLSKQIEQKAKEAAKNRKTAEDKLAEAEKALQQVHAFNAQSAEADRSFSEASDSFKAKDYKSVLSHSTHCLEACNKARSARIEEVLLSASDLLDLGQGRHVVSPQIKNLISTAKEDVEHGRFEHGFNTAKELYEKADQLVNRTVAEAFGEAQTKALFLEGIHINIDSERSQLGRARKALEEGRYKDSLKDIDSCLDSLTNLTAEHFRVTVEAIRELESFAFDAHFDLTKVSEKVEAAQQRMEAHDFEEAFADLSSADTEVRRALAKGMNGFLTTARRRSASLKELGVDVAMTLALNIEAKEFVKEENFPAANGAITRLRQLLVELERTQLARSLARMRSRLLIAQRLKVDLAGSLRCIEEAKQAQEKGDLPLAIRKVDDADKELNTTLAGYQEVEDELVEFRNVLERAKGLGLSVDEATRTAALARRAALRKDFGSAASLLRDSKRELQTAIQGHYGKLIIRIELDLALALRIGADVREESSILDGLVVKVKKNEFGIAEAELKELSLSIKQRIVHRAQHVVIQARKTIESYKGPMDLTEAQALLVSSDEELQKENYASAYDLAQNAVETLKKEEILQVDSRIEEAERLLTIMTELECESHTLKEKYRRALELRSQRMFGEATRLASEVVQFGSSIIKEELSRQMAKVGKAINISRKKGVEVSAPEHFIEGAWRALNSDRMDEAFSLMNDSMEELRRMNQLHAEVYDNITEVRSLLHQAEDKNVAVGNAAKTLESAQDLFEEGRYAEARDLTQKAYQEVERTASELIVPQLLEEAEELVDVAGRVRADTERLSKDLAHAKELEASGKHLEAITTAKDVKNASQAVVVAALQREINTSRSTIQRSQASGMDMTSADLIVSKAESLLTEGSYNDSWRALELARTDLDQSVFMEQKAKDLLHQTEQEIREVEELGLDIGSAQDMLQKAYFLQRAGNHALALELAKKAEIISANSAMRMVKDRLSALDGQYQLGNLSGPDYIQSAKRKEDVLNLSAQKRFKEAIILLGPYEMELMELRRNREQAQLRMRQLDQRLQSAQSAGRLSDYGRQMALKAQEKIEEGAYSESLMLMARCDEELQNLGDMFDSRQRELGGLREDLEFVLDAARKRSISALLDQAEAALGKLDFERASLFLRRGRAALMEATGHEVGQCFEELMALTRLMEREGIEVPANGAIDGSNGHVTKMNEIRPKDLERLRSEVAEFRRIVNMRFRERMRQVSEKVGRASADGQEVSASMKLLNHAEELQRKGQMEEAFATVEASDRLQGVPWNDYQEFNKVREDIIRRIGAIKLAGGDLTEEERRLSEAEREMLRDSGNALHTIRALRSELQRRMEEMAPDVGVDITFLEDPKAGKWTKAVVRVSNQGTGPAKSVSVQLRGPIEVKGGRFLPLVSPGKTERFGVEICPRSSGKLVITLVLEAKSQLTDEDCGYEGDFEMRVI